MFSLYVTYFDMAIGRKQKKAPSIPDIMAEDPCEPLLEPCGEMTYELISFGLHFQADKRPPATETIAKIQELATSGSGGVEASKFNKVIQQLGEVIQGLFDANQTPDQIDKNLSIKGETEKAI